jgi:hypothetical protein
LPKRSQKNGLTRPFAYANYKAVAVMVTSGHRQVHESASRTRAWQAATGPRQQSAKKQKCYERSRNVVDNKPLLFLEFIESRNVFENKLFVP